MTFHDFLHGDLGLLIRVIAGCAIFATLAIIDIQKNGANATRWKEYGVLLASVLAGLFYGVINDQLTVSISPEYFIYGKELDHIIGDHPPMGRLRYEAAKVGLKATWTAGLIFGVALLLANNPCKSLPRLRNRQLLMYLPIIMLTAAAGGTLGGWLGYHGHLTRLDSDFKFLIESNLYRPYRFMCTWGVHLGGYVGGAIGTIIAAGLLMHQRKSRHQYH
jgi:hypothetical protein